MTTPATVALTFSPASPSGSSSTFTINAQVTPATGGDLVVMFSPSSGFQNGLSDFINNGQSSVSLEWDVSPDNDMPAQGTYVVTAIFMPSDATNYTTSSVAAYSYTVGPSGSVNGNYPTITTGTTLPAATVGAAYPATQLAAAHGTGPYSWTGYTYAPNAGSSGGSGANGAPPGMVLSSAGVLSGTPTSSGTYVLQAAVTDANGYKATALFAVPIGATGSSGNTNTGAGTGSSAPTGSPSGSTSSTTGYDNDVYDTGRFDSTTVAAAAGGTATATGGSAGTTGAAPSGGTSPAGGTPGAGFDHEVFDTGTFDQTASQSGGSGGLASATGGASATSTGGTTSAAGGGSTYDTGTFDQATFDSGQAGTAGYGAGGVGPNSPNPPVIGDATRTASYYPAAGSVYAGVGFGRLALPAWWAARLAIPHRMRTTAFLLRNGSPVAVMPSVVPEGGQSSAPQITYATGAATGWTAALSFLDGDGTWYDLCSPGTYEMAVYSGVDDGVGGWFDVPYGVYGITQRTRVDTSMSSDYGPVLNLTGADRGQALSAAKVTDAWEVYDGESLGAATARLVLDQLPWLPARCILLDDQGITMPSQVLDGQADPWSTIQGWWNDRGLRIGWDRYGNLVGVDPANQSLVPVRTFGPGAGLYGIPADTTDITQSANGVTVSVSNPGSTPVRATVWDNNPASDTYVGKIGYRPAKEVSIATAQSVDDCYRAGVIRLPQVCLLAQTWQLDTVADPSIDPYDIVSVWDKRTGAYVSRQITAMTHTGHHSQQSQPECIPLTVATPLEAAAA